MDREIKNTKESNFQIFFLTILFVLIWPVSMPASERRDSSLENHSDKYFQIKVVDRQTGRGVPLVQLRTTNNIRYYTDSNGIIAFYEPGLMDTEVFFFVESHGYEFPNDGFGFHGKRLRTTPGGNAVITIDRLNIAERLYRVTGQGIYRDSILTGHPVPLKNPVLNGKVAGQDSVYTCIYQDRLFWMWGDTSRPSYPLGHFAMAGALSDLPERGGLNPAIGVDLEYFVDKTGFSRPMSPMKEPGLLWLDGLLTVKDNQGRDRMVAQFARLKDLGTVLERGLVVFNDATQTFEPLIRPGVDYLPYHVAGHPLLIDVEDRKYYYFATPFPLSVRMRVRAKWEDIIDANCYEALTALESKSVASRETSRLDLTGAEKAHRWIRFDQLLSQGSSMKSSVIEALKKEKEDTHLYDIESGKKIAPHGGTVYFNEYRQRWVAIFVQQFGDSSFLGEVWYAEADTPVGPWAYTRRIVTHDKYSFYNPAHHPYFDQDGGRVLFLEGTYSHTFSGSAETATPRYDYNQIMYRLNLDDARLALPVAVYQVQDEQCDRDYMLRNDIEKNGKWNVAESILFFAVEPGRAPDDLIPIHAQKISAGNKQTIRLTTESPDTTPLFYALPSGDPSNEKPHIISLYEYHHTETGQYRYSTDPVSRQKGWIHKGTPLCRVWKAPSGPILLDSKAKPAAGH
jgi:hypothetical protein